MVSALRIGVGEVAVRVDRGGPASGGGVEAGGAGDGVVAREVGPVGVGVGVDPDLRVVHQPGGLRIGAVAGEQLVGEPQQEDHAAGLVAVHGGGQEDLGLVLLPFGVVGDAQGPQAVGPRSIGRLPQDLQPAQLGMGLGQALQQPDVLLVGGVAVPGPVRVRLPAGGTHGHKRHLRLGDDGPREAGVGQLPELAGRHQSVDLAVAHVGDAYQPGELVQAPVVGHTEADLHREVTIRRHSRKGCEQAEQDRGQSEAHVQIVAPQKRAWLVTTTV